MLVNSKLIITIILIVLNIKNNTTINIPKINISDSISNIYYYDNYLVFKEDSKLFDNLNINDNVKIILNDNIYLYRIIYKEMSNEEVIIKAIYSGKLVKM